ncbi:MAG TPA: response regulator [Terriglobia bacterium]|nr:response regulator [Terriglobia bacterium]
MALKILVVDDEESFLKLFKSMIEPLGCEVRTLADSREALKCLSEERFDGVFLDARMPHLDGFELASHTRTSSINSQTPIVMLTGMDDVKTMQRAFSVGITFFLGKPFDREKLYGLYKALRGTMLREKRRHARIPVHTLVTCQVGEKHFRTSSLNLGESGMLLESSGGVEVGTKLNLEFALPELQRVFTAQAKVIRKEAPDHMAVQFTNLDPETRNILESYVAGRLKD